ncbi:hypothetical protein KIN20_022478 [Parelaphostrongylus tenuis]|uniref:Uncharacterized protein n=1 Tax=Parelaphostrongylus tenuis TaxID=148309 RepID=A0AAD5QUV4_PARTN|nr:hypothetical protein KIN20_022478 [Parelaphostrongylus tenuis]
MTYGCCRGPNWSISIRRFTTHLLNGIVMRQPHCIIVGSTVTALCDGLMPNGQARECDLGKNMFILPITSNYTSISGTLTTSNIVMANWSNEMWQRIVNRAIRMLASDPFGVHFISAFATVV